MNVETKHHEQIEQPIEQQEQLKQNGAEDVICNIKNDARDAKKNVSDYCDKLYGKTPEKLEVFDLNEFKTKLYNLLAPFKNHLHTTIRNLLTSGRNSADDIFGNLDDDNLIASGRNSADDIFGNLDDDNLIASGRNSADDIFGNFDDEKHIVSGRNSADDIVGNLDDDNLIASGRNSADDIVGNLGDEKHIVS